MWRALKNEMIRWAFGRPGKIVEERLPSIYEETQWQPERLTNRVRAVLGRLLNDRAYARLRYLNTFGRWPRLAAAVTYNEKILWRMLNDRNPLFPTLIDKHTARGVVAERGGARLLKQLYAVVDDPADLPYEQLPARFAFKPNHGSGWLLLVKDKTYWSRPQLEALSHKWLKQNYYHRAREWAYGCIRPRLLVEELLERDGDVGQDYKFYCFDGQPRVVHVDCDRFSARPTTNFYALPWQPLQVQDVFARGPARAAPPQLEDMLAHAAALSAGLDFVRVDLTLFEGRIVFGEFTLYPLAGVGRFNPDSFDEVLGQFWRLPQAL